MSIKPRKRNRRNFDFESETFQSGGGSASPTQPLIIIQPIKIVQQHYHYQASPALISELKEIIRKEVKEEIEADKSKVVVLNPVSRDEAKKLIIGLIKQEDGVYYSDIAYKLGLELETTVEICSELEAEGKIKGST